MVVPRTRKVVLQVDLLDLVPERRQISPCMLPRVQVQSTVLPAPAPATIQFLYGPWSLLVSRGPDVGTLLTTITLLGTLPRIPTPLTTPVSSSDPPDNHATIWKKE